MWREAGRAEQWLPHCLRQVRATYAVLISLDLPGQVLDIVKNLTTELRLSSLNNILTSVVEETYILHEREDWQQELSDHHGATTALPKVYEELVLEAVSLIKEAVLAIDNREEDILSHSAARQSTELLVQKVLSAFAFALENAATENYYRYKVLCRHRVVMLCCSDQSEVPADSRRLLACLNNCRYTELQVLPRILAGLGELEQLSLEKPAAEARGMYAVLDQKLFDAYMELKCEPIIAIIEPNMYTGKFDWAKCVRPTGNGKS